MLNPRSVGCGAIFIRLWEIIGFIKQRGMRHLAIACSLLLVGMTFSPAAYADEAGSESSGESGGADDGGGGDCASGDCGEENSQNGETNDSGDGEVCRDEDECPCDSGNGQQGTPQNEPGGPTKNHPVSWSTGEKWETVVDLRVKVRGADFRLTRQYNSNPGMFNDNSGDLYTEVYRPSSYLGTVLSRQNANPNVGEGWAFSNLRAMTAWSNQTCKSIDCSDNMGNGWTAEEPGDSGIMGWLLRPSRKPRQYTIDISGFGSPGNQSISVVNISNWGTTTGFVCHDCNGVPAGIPSGFFTGTLRYSEPGKWHQDFDIQSGFGWISVDEDEYGNRREYIDTDGDRIPDQIYLNGSTLNWNDGDRAEAMVQLHWEGSTAAPLLIGAEVYRPSASGDVLTQNVDYYHLINDNGLKVKHYNLASDTWEAVSGLTPSSDLGSDGDLVQVVRYTAVDPEASTVEFRPLVTQYRYHNDTAAAAAGTDIRLRTQGKLHQLKMEFMPQQLEHLAQLTSTASTPSDMTVVDEATDLLALDDDASIGSTGHKVFEAAEKVISYTRTGESVVDFQFLQATNCGCGSSGSTSATVLTYDMIEGWTETFGSPPIATDVDGQSMHISEYDLSGRTMTDAYPWDDTVTPYRTFCYDMLLLGDNESYPYVWHKAVIDEATGNAWVTKKLYDLDDRAVTGMIYPSGIASYVKATSLTPPSTTSASDGLRVKYAYSSGNENVSTVSTTPTGGALSFTQLSSVEYRDDHESREYLPEKRIGYRTGASGADLEEVVEYEYGFEAADSGKVDWRRIRTERELETENGPSGTGNWVEEWEIYDDQGLLVYRIDPDQVITHYEYNEVTGVLSKITRNAAAPSSSEKNALGVPDGTNGAPADPFPAGPFDPTQELVTEYQRDKLGRMEKVIRPGGVNTWTAREMRENPDRPGILYYTKVSLPHNINAASPKTFAGPAHVRLFDSSGDIIRRSSYELSSTASYNPDEASGPDYTTGDEIARSALSHDLSGSVTSSEIWWDVSADESYTASTEYDAFGRVTRVTDGNGNITERDYDVMDRVTELRVGAITDPVTSTEVAAQYFYDGDPAATPAHGVGNGNLTTIVKKDGIGDRVTRLYYDHRDRRIATVAPASPMSITRFDNLSRPIEQGVYPEPTSAPSLSDIRSFADSSLAEDGTGLNLPNSEKRSWYTKYHYSQRGRSFRQQIAIDPTQSSPSFLEWNGWLDVKGNELASWGPNAPIVVNEYDEHDRLTKVMIADRTTDTAAADWDFDAATSVSGDYVLEQSEYRYEDNSGLLDLVTNRMRLHDDETTTGSLGGADSISTYLGYIYDNANRGKATVAFGTNKSGANPFSAAAGTVPTLTDFDSLSELRDAGDGVLFNWREYNPRGLVEDLVSIQSGNSASDEIRTRYLYDDLYRSIAMVENADAVSSLAWDGTENRYTVSGFDYMKQDTDRVTSFAHNAVGNVVKRVAHIPEQSGSSTVEGVQVTEYVYGVLSGSTANIMDSLVNSNNLLAEVRYPDESTGQAGTTDEYKVKYSYNRLGELRGVTDQNGTLRHLSRDQRGRIHRDIVSTVGSGVDDTIRMIQYDFDTSGRLEQVSSYTDTGAITIRDQVEIGYTPLWQIETVTQQHDDVVSASSPQVLYRYDNQAINAGTKNYSRVSAVVYPTDNDGNISDKTVEYTYNAGTGYDGLDNRISRVSKIGVESLTGVTGVHDLITYDRIGLGMTALAHMPNAGTGIQLDRTVNHDGSRPTDAYPAFDRFGRVVRHMWVRDDFTTYAEANPGYTGSYTGSNQPAIVEITHSYDRQSNRLSYNDARNGARFEDRNRLFSYDGLNRLTEDLRLDSTNDDGSGNPLDDTLPLPPTSTYTSQHLSRSWDLDMLGNWSSTTSDGDEDGDLSDNQGNGYLDSRGANAANEYEGELNTQYDRRVYNSVGSRYYDYAYDKNGNLTEDRSGTALPLPPSKMSGLIHTYDAWNRMVKSEFEPNSGPNVTVSEYTYNGLGWRTSKKFDSATGAYDGLDQERILLYDASWRILEEHIDTDLDSTVDWISQEFWGLRYIDDSVAKRVDRNADGIWTDSFTSEWYRVTDTQYSVVAVLDSDAQTYERIEYDAYGQARHRYAGDVNGDGILTINDLLAANGAGNITHSNWHADLDTDFSGILDKDEGLAYQSAPSSSLPKGWISDPSDSNGPDNSIGYAGYVFNAEREDYLVRSRVYDPETAKWHQRDSSHYVDGSSLYQYVRSNPLRFVDFSGKAASDPSKQAEAARKCKEWADKESQRDQSWRDDLPDCPCSLDISDPDDPKKPKGPWKCPEVRDQGINTWEPYHPKAKYQIRSKANGDGAGQQCTYDESGNLITGGESSGTPDRVTPNFYYVPLVLKDLRYAAWALVTGGENGLTGEDFLPNTVIDHRTEDVKPFAACRDADMLDTYFKYRPPNQGDNGNGEPCESNELD